MGIRSRSSFNALLSDPGAIIIGSSAQLLGLHMIIFGDLSISVEFGFTLSQVGETIVTTTTTTTTTAMSMSLSLRVQSVSEQYTLGGQCTILTPFSNEIHPLSFP